MCYLFDNTLKRFCVIADLANIKQFGETNLYMRRLDQTTSGGEPLRNSVT